MQNHSKSHNLTETGHITEIANSYGIAKKTRSNGTMLRQRFTDTEKKISTETAFPCSPTNVLARLCYSLEIDRVAELQQPPFKT